MPQNIEIKARVEDLPALRARALALATERAVVLQQHDVFFAAPHGRLKLRIFDEGRGELIAYERPDARDPQSSDYRIAPTDRPAALREALARALGEVGEVRKRRELILVDRTRVHLDEVEGLGTFMELEVVLRDDEEPAAGVTVARDLMRALAVRTEDLVDVAYIDLLR